VQETQPIRRDIRPKRPLTAWFDIRRRKLGSLAFALNRLTGLGLTFYLFLHLGILSLLLRGEQGWDDFIAVAKSPLFLIMDIVLIFGLLFHGLNGIRVGLVGTGIGVKNQRLLFWIFAALTIILVAVGGTLIFLI
jgi:succinate dehydrogenase / fumarate reductase cytochrome b subunit